MLIQATRQDLEMLGSSFYFEQISELMLPRFQDALMNIAEKSATFSSQPISLNYILIQVNEMGMDKANDIAFISHNMDGLTTSKQKFIIKGERMKYEHALMLGSAHCLSVGADTVYHYRNEDFKWK